MNLLYLWGRYWLMTCSPGASPLCGGLSWDGASLSRVGRTGGGGGSAGHTPLSGMPVAQRICWNRFLRGEESSIKCWFPASLWSSLGLVGCTLPVGCGGRQGVLRVTRAPAAPPSSQLLPAPATAGVLFGLHELDHSLITSWCLKPAIRDTFLWAVSASYNGAICPPCVCSSRAPCWDRHTRRVQRGGWAGAPGAGSQAPTLRAQPTPDLTQGSF